MSSESDNTFVEDGLGDSLYDDVDLISDEAEDGPQTVLRSARWPRRVLDCDGKLQRRIETHIRLWNLQGDYQGFCAVFDLPFPEINRDLLARMNLQGMQEIGLGLGGRDYVEQSVLIRIIEVPQQGQEWREGRMVTMVRLQRLDRCNRPITQAVQPSFTYGDIETLVVISDGELESSVSRRRSGLRLMDRNRVNQVVERRSHTVQRVTRDQRESGRRKRCQQGDDQAMAGTLFVSMTSDSVRLQVVPCRDFAVESLEVFFGP